MINAFRRSHTLPNRDHSDKKLLNDSPRDPPPPNTEHAPALSAIDESIWSPPLNIISGTTNGSPREMSAFALNDVKKGVAASPTYGVESPVQVIEVVPECDLEDGADDEELSHPTSYMLSTEDNADRISLVDTPLPPYMNSAMPASELLSPRSPGSDEDVLFPLSPVSGPTLLKSPISELMKLETLTTPPVQQIPALLVTTSSAEMATAQSAALSGKSNAINPALALSNDLLDRQILKSQDDDDAQSAGLLRTNAILMRKSPQKEVEELQAMIQRSRSVKTSTSKRKNSDPSVRPLMFSQANSLSRSKSMISTKHLSPEHRETLDLLQRNGSLKIGMIPRVTEEINDERRLEGEPESKGDYMADNFVDGANEVDNCDTDDPLSSFENFGSAADSTYFQLTNETELNCTKQLLPRTSLLSRSGAKLASAIQFKSFYKAENNTLNMRDGHTERVFWAPHPRDAPAPRTDLNGDRVAGDDGDGSGDLGDSPNFHRVSNQNGQLPPPGGTPGDSPLTLASSKMRKREQNKTVLIWALIVMFVVSFCIFVPLIVVYSRGTEDTTKKYLENISVDHRRKLLDPFLESQYNQTNMLNDAQQYEKPTASISGDEVTEVSSKVYIEEPYGRVRGGLRNSKFKTKSIAGISKFSEIPLKFQRSHELKNIMDDSRLHNVFYGIDYAPKNVIYPSCGSTLSEVMLDVALLSQITSRIRTYGTQCNQTRHILQSINMLNLNVSVAAGVWIGSNEENNERQIRELKAVLGEYPRENFESIFVGNEVLFRNDQTSEKLIQYIQSVKSFVQMELNWDLPVGTSDVGYRTDPTVLNACDLYGSNTHPFFQGEDVHSATQWVFDYMQYQIEPFKHLAVTESNIPKVMISEVGWPSEGGSYKSATAGTEQMQDFLSAWVCEAGKQKYPWYLFEAFDEPWKEIYHREGAEWDAHWGLFTSDRKLKEGIVLPNCTGVMAPL